MFKRSIKAYSGTGIEHFFTSEKLIAFLLILFRVMSFLFFYIYIYIGERGDNEKFSHRTHGVKFLFQPLVCLISSVLCLFVLYSNNFIICMFPCL